MARTDDDSWDLAASVGATATMVAAQDLHCSVHVIVRLGEDARSLREVVGVVGHRRWPVCPRAVTNCGSPRRVRVERRA
jgi:hypothetical protein